MRGGGRSASAAVGALAMVGTLALAGCNSSPSSPSSSAGSSTPTPLVDATRVVGAFRTANLPVDGLADATAEDCAEAGCVQALTSTQVSVLSFLTSGRAEIYANTEGLYHVVSVALRFPPGTDGATQSRYEAVLARTVT